MASASYAARLCIAACRRAPRAQRLPRAQQLARQRAVAQRAFRATAARWDNQRGKGEEEADEGELDDEEVPRVIELKRLDKSIRESATTEVLQRFDELAKEEGHNSIDDCLRSNLGGSTLAAEDRALDEELRRDDVGEKPSRSSFWYDDEDPETNTDEHDDFDEDDITSMAHGKLDEVREMRHYARLAVWEMPLLSKLAKAFVPPGDDQVLRWRYTTYMGEAHPAEKKVVVQFAPDDLKLTPVQTEKLKKLAGPRYNPETELVKMSCESFEHQAQNKRYLSDLVDDLVAAAKDGTDAFEDVPLDLRHHKAKAKPRFPAEWRLTDERRLQLDEGRQRAALADREKAVAGLLVNGKKAVETYLMEQHMSEEAEKQEKAAQLVAAPVRGARAGSRARR